jgi:hypothetical protein
MTAVGPHKERCGRTAIAGNGFALSRPTWSQPGRKEQPMMNSNKIVFCIFLLFILAASTAFANDDIDKEIYQSSRFALGIGAAIVKFDTKL